MSKRIVVITGASDDVGAAAARGLAAAGDNVVVIGRSVYKTKAIYGLATAGMGLHLDKRSRGVGPP